ncbi:class I SAM-dependent methyltransferase [Daejeonella lutea]|nr:class I SAM-dependent methyltransferase [Daejeonella lutea]
MYRAEDKLWWYVGLRDLLKYFVMKHHSADPRILDAGCGTGKNIEFLNSLGYTNVSGFDFSHDAVEFCRKRGLDHVTRNSITEILHPDSFFDIVYCLDVMGSLGVEDRAHAVSEMFRVLKPGGFLICNTAALELFRSQHDDVSNIAKRFSREEFLMLFEGYHRRINKLTYRVFLLSPLILIYKLGKKLLARIGGSSRSKSDQVIFPLGINWFLTQIQLLENKIIEGIDLPFGSSIFIVLTKA